jgi:hypothetical protein
MLVLAMTALAPIDDVLRRWRAGGVRLLPPIEETDVIAAFAKTGRKISSDVVGLYCATRGMEDGEMDELFSLWPLERVMSESSSYGRTHIPFADFLINSHFYCFRFENEKRSSVYIDYLNGEEPERVAGSIAEFFDLYLREPGKLEMFE